MSDVTQNAPNAFPESAMIALLPAQTDWCKIDFPHLTLVYAGKIADLPPADFNVLAKDACSIAMMSGPFSLKVTGTAVFGDGTPDSPQVDVLTLENTTLLQSMRHFVESWNASQHPDFRPHCTVGPVGSAGSISLPMYLTFDRICVSWGTQNLPFWLKNQYG